MLALGVHHLQYWSLQTAARSSPHRVTSPTEQSRLLLSQLQHTTWGGGNWSTFSILLLTTPAVQHWVICHLFPIPVWRRSRDRRWRCRWWWRLLWLDINTSTCQLRRISLHWLLLVLSKPPTVYIMSEHQTWSSLPPHTQHRAAPLMLSLTRGGSSMFCLQAVQSLPDLTSQGRHNKWKNSDFFFTVFLHQWNYRYNKQQHPIWKIQN